MLCERVSVKTHSVQSRFGIGPKNLLFAGLCACALSSTKRLQAGTVKALNPFNAELSPKRYRPRTEIPGGGGKGRLYLALHSHHQNDFCNKVGSDESRFNVSLTVKDKVTRQCSQTTHFKERGQPKFTRRLTARPNCFTLSVVSLNTLALHVTA